MSSSYDSGESDATSEFQFDLLSIEAAIFAQELCGVPSKAVAKILSLDWTLSPANRAQLETVASNEEDKLTRKDTFLEAAWKVYLEVEGLLHDPEHPQPECVQHQMLNVAFSSMEDEDSASQEDSIHSTPPPSGRSSSPALPGAVTGRKRVHSDSDCQLAPSKKRRLAEESAIPSTALCRLAAICRDHLNSSGRLFSVGICVEGSTVRLAYFDRMVAVQTHPSSFESCSFALIAYALFKTLPNVGENPFVHAPPLSATGSDIPICEGLAGSCFQFPNKNGGFDKFEVLGVVHQPRQLIGRATTVYRTKAFLANPTKLTHGHEVALKLSWQPVGPERPREPEASIIHKIRERVPPIWRRHLPEVFFSATYTPEELNIPWCDATSQLKFDKDFERRNLHVLAMPIYRRLEEVITAEELFTVWCHVFETHHQVYAAGKYLHRDISINNIMFTRDGDSGPVIGILNDFDLALDMDPKNQGITDPATTPRASGTLPFMASDLHQDLPPSQHYHHELESLVYVLLFVASHLDLKQHKYRSTPEPLRRWNSNVPQDLCAMKAGWRSLLTFHILLTKILVPEFKPLHKLLFQLSRFLAQATMEVDEEIVKEMQCMEGEVDLTVALAMTARQQDLLSQKITYDTFKAVVKDHCGNYPYPDESSVQPPTAS